MIYFEGCDCNDVNSNYCSGTTIFEWGINPWPLNENYNCQTSEQQYGPSCSGCNDTPDDGYCDCNGNELDECDVCGGDGIAAGACDCDGNIPVEPFCDCEGNTLDCNGICGGDNLHCVGCIYETACNYDSLATIDNGTCEFAEYGYDCNGNELSITDSQLPYSYNINSIYPNPFNPITTISFSIPQSGLVSLKVYNISGKLSTTLKDEYMNVGYYDIIWDATNYPSGIYFVKMVSGGVVEVEKVVLVK
jgi:hypothetical protein